jgi:hypothetical protein
MPEKPDFSGPLIPGGSPRLRGYYAKEVRAANERYQRELQIAQKRFAVIKDVMWGSFSVAGALAFAGSVALCVEIREKKKQPINHW